MLDINIHDMLHEKFSSQFDHIYNYLWGAKSTIKNANHIIEMLG